MELFTLLRATPVIAAVSAATASDTMRSSASAFYALKDIMSLMKRKVL